MIPASFRQAVRGPQAPQQEVRNSWGVYDYYKYYRKTKPKGHKYVLSESQYFAIIRKINQKLSEELLTYRPLTLPLRMGTVEILKRPVVDKIVNGKLKSNRFVDWNSTLELWYNDPEAYKKKTLVRHEWKERFHVQYCPWKGQFKNKAFYQFRATKSTMERLIQQVRNGFIDAPYFMLEGVNIKDLYNG